MNRIAICIAVLFCAAPVLAQPSARVTENKATATIRKNADLTKKPITELDLEFPDEAAVRKNVETYIEAFNRGDAEAVATLWSEQGEWVTPDGTRVQGRAAIEAEMRAYFEEGQGAQLSLRNIKLRFLAVSVAVEEGVARVVRPGEVPEETTYIAIHVKNNGQWKLDTVRETALVVPASNYQHLQPLEWMIGTWVDKDGESMLETKCEWTKNKNFMVRSFRVKIKDRIELEGTQVIGYDGARKQIRSWVFDTAGGIGEGRWSQEGNRWTVKSSHVLPSGERGSSINVITPVDDSTFRWQSTGREAGGEILPDIEPVTIVRK